ncbi:Translation initiation factor eIF-2B subunit epsilon [Amphibalanus amphitrite]|uniref:Translation initiation factor eIF2B subunit epsilon n=1 Tax=Amphibalanus amphitrite TaxID=1232801 RepID=A0A6A4WZZ4_AMPAM|nr:Translation initiation factor eIF-2B subunit epsilon [Amphibalanus amphitrite]
MSLPHTAWIHHCGTRWLSEDSPMVIHVQTAEDCLSLGDVMRDLDAKALIQSDFLLMSVDCITNVDIVPIMKEHSARRKNDDRGSVMTLLYREATPGHPMRRHSAQVLLAADAETGRMVFHQRLPAAARGRVTFPLHIFQEQSAVELHYDLADTGLSICSPSVPQLFADNFDFQTRDHFVRGIIVNEEVMGNTVYHRRVGTQYAAHIDSLATLLTVTQDVTDRWVHPVVPENRCPQRADLRCSQRNVYRHRTAKVGSGTRLEGCVALGAGASVGSNCRLLRAVVGPGCLLGDNVTLEDAVLDAGCVLADRCEVRRSLLGPGVQLAAGARLHPGCVLGAGVRVEGAAELPQGTLLVGRPPEDEFGGGSVPEPSRLVGAGGRGFTFLPEEDEEDTLSPLRLGPAELPTAELSDSGENSEEETEDESEERLDGAESPEVVDDTKLFYSEVLDSLVRGFQEKISPENLILEVNSSKFAYNVTVQELNSLVVKAILSVPEHGSDERLAAPAFLARLQPVLTTFMPLLTNYIKSEESELSCLRALEEFSCDHSAMSACLAKVLMLLYQRDILSETTILSWHAESEGLSPESVRVRQQVQKLVDWLQEAEEESEDEESDEDSS